MGRSPTISPSLELRTLIAVRELDDGTELCFPVADPSLVSHGQGGSALGDQRLFLEEYLPAQPPEVVARFSTPEGTELKEIEVEVRREDLPPRLQLRAPVSFGCVVIPHGRDRWVLVPAIDHVLHVAAGEEVERVVQEEIRRMVAALEPTPQELARILPPRGHRLEPLVLNLDRSAHVVAGTGRALRKKAVQRRQQAEALEVLESVGIGLHASEEVLRGPPLSGRDRELELLSGLLGGKQRLSVMLVGPELSGKTALVRGWLRRELEAGGRRLVFASSGAQLIAGMSGLGQWQERVQRVVQAAERLDAVLYFDNLGDLFGDRPEGQVDLAGALRPCLEEGRVRLVGELRPEALDLFESRHVGFVSALQRVRLEPMDAAQALAVLEARVAHATRHEPQRPNLAPEAARPLIELVDRYLPYQSHPGKGVRLYEELRTIHEGAASHAAEPEAIGEPEILETFALQSGIPLFLLRQDQALKLEHVQSSLGRRLVGQEEAVRRVAETICVVKANLQPAGKPLATFLFVGPTGVGKTELARSLAVFLFGSEQRLVRFDMSEYCDLGAAQRLIRGTERAEGLLTRRVRQQPFCVLLLDEIEKAHPAVFDLLLQVCGEGRLTDAAGRTAYFHNTMIIMTSNLGAAHRRAVIGVTARPVGDQAYYLEQVERAFRPEFVNRLDRVISFHPLAGPQVEEIARIALRRIGRRRGLAELGLTVEVTDGALARLAGGGVSEAYGARQLQRHLDEQVVTPVARLLARLGLRARGGVIRVRLPEELEAPGPRGPELPGRPRGARGPELARERVGELELAVLGGKGQARGVGAGPLAEISHRRREVDRYLALETPREVKDQIDFIVAQLSNAGGGRRRGEQDAGARGGELNELRIEHHRLQQLWQRAMELRTDLETAEELALTALYEDEELAPYVEESEVAFQRFLVALFHLLVARRPGRDRATLLVQELDDRGGMQPWLGGLFGELERLGWSLLAHVDGGRRTAEDRWPGDRRWGPPRAAGWLAEQLARPERSFRNLLLRVSGPYAGAVLALEAGFHRYGQWSGEPLQLHLQLVARRTELTDEEWVGPALVPPSPASFGELRRLAPVRELVSPAGPCRVVGGAREVACGLEAYWERIESIAVQHLLARIDKAGEEGLDDLFLPKLPGEGR